MRQQTARLAVPDLETLRARLLPLVGASDASGGDGVTLTRRTNEYATYYASDVVTLEWPDGRTLRLLIKYGEAEERMADDLLTIGPAYESRVYQQVLAGIGVAVPRCFGTWRDAETGAASLVIEHLDGVHANRAPDLTQGMALAAAWAGRLHALTEPAVRAHALPALNVYDDRLYRYWAERTRRFERQTHTGRTWLPGLIDRIDAAIEMLRAAPQSLIHGDFYPDNMLYRDGAIFVFDWEQTAIAPGEIDLASLTHLWHDEVVDAAVYAYQRTRWPEGAPTDFVRRLDAARVYVLLRLLGEGEEWPSREMRDLRLDLLRQAADRLGLI